MHCNSAVAPGLCHKSVRILGAVIKSTGSAVIYSFSVFIGTVCSRFRNSIAVDHSAYYRVHIKPAFCVAGGRIVIAEIRQIILSNTGLTVRSSTCHIPEDQTAVHNNSDIPADRNKLSVGLYRTICFV